MTEEQINKLPKWAQIEVKSLQFQNLYLIEKLKEINSESDTNTFIRDGLDKRPLQRNAQVEFRTGDRDANSVTVYRRSDGLIDVNTDSRLGHTMVIIPRASNSFYINFIKD